MVALGGCGGDDDVATSHDDDVAPSTQRGGTGPYNVPVVHRVQPRQLAAFAALRSPPEGLPVAAQRLLRNPPYGMNLRLAQRIPVGPEGSFWLVPGKDHLCMVSRGVMGGRGVTTTCATTSSAIAHGITDISITLPGRAHRQRLIVGAARDGARSALVHTGGATATVPIHNGLFVLRDTTFAPPDSITVR